jgi:hypothetical protein
MPHDAGPAFFVLRHKDVEGGLWEALWLAPSFFCHWPSFRLFALIILGGRYSPMMTSSPLVVSAWDGQTKTFFPSSSAMFIFTRNGSLLSFIW